MHRTVLRAATAALAAALLMGLPAVPASADDLPTDLRGLPAEIQSNDALMESVVAARAQFRESALAARTALRTAVSGARAQVVADTARAAAKSSLITARAMYAVRVSMAFSRYAPGTTVPKSLLDPSWWPRLTDSAWLAS